MSGRIAINELDHRYGKLIVIERAMSKGKGARWFCKCACGNETVVAGSNLRKGCTKSCGCLVEAIREARKLPFGDAALNRIIYRMKRRAKERGYIWNLTKEQVRMLTQKSCYYCNAEPSQREADRPGGNGTYIYNGLDRINNDKGYLLENVVPCCRVCNTAKSQMPQGEFLAWISRVYKHSVNRE